MSWMIGSWPGRGTQYEITASRHFPRQSLTELAAHLVDSRGVEEHHIATLEATPGHTAGGNRLAMERAGAEVRLAEQCIQQRGLADTDPAENGDMNLAFLETLQQCLDLGIIGGELRTYRRRHPVVL
jgi:hypothetical protein